MTHLKFKEQLVRDHVVLSQGENTEVHGMPRGRPSSSEYQRPIVYAVIYKL
jgi:hypothetical protein